MSLEWSRKPKISETAKRLQICLKQNFKRQRAFRIGSWTKRFKNSIPLSLEGLFGSWTGLLWEDFSLWIFVNGWTRVDHTYRDEGPLTDLLLIHFNVWAAVYSSLNHLMSFFLRSLLLHQNFLCLLGYEMSSSVVGHLYTPMHHPR